MKDRSHRNRRLKESERKRPVYFDRNHQQMRADAEVLLKQIPPDTRDLTSRLMGDPLPGRRALDARQGA
jgi:hypothetical protein